LGLAELPYQWLSELGLPLPAALAPSGRWGFQASAVAASAALPPWPSCCGLEAVGCWAGAAAQLAWLVLQDADTDWQKTLNRAIANLSLSNQLARLPLLALPISRAERGARIPLAALRRFSICWPCAPGSPPSAGLPLALTVAIGGVPASVLPFHHPLRGPPNALEELSAVVLRFQLLVPTLLLAGIGTAAQFELGDTRPPAKGMLCLAALSLTGRSPLLHQCGGRLIALAARLVSPAVPFASAFCSLLRSHLGACRRWANRSVCRLWQMASGASASTTARSL